MMVPTVKLEIEFDNGAPGKELLGAILSRISADISLGQRRGICLNGACRWYLK